MLGRVGHDRGRGEARRVERGPNRGDLTIHHCAWGDDVGTGTGLADSRGRQSINGAVVVHLTGPIERTAVPVIRVLAETGVRDRGQRQAARTDPTECLLDRASVVGSLGSDLVLRLG